MAEHLCDYAHMNHGDRAGLPASIPGACYNSPATRLVTITYTCGKIKTEQETLMLCGDCTRIVRRDCRRHGYRFKSRKLA